LCGASVALGVRSLNAPLLAVRVARVIAALGARRSVSEEDAAAAARLVIAPRATMMPADPQEAQSDAERPPDASETSDPARDNGPLQDVVVAAAKAAIPPGLLALLRAQAVRSKVSSSGRGGALQKASRRGRPTGVRRGSPGGGARMNVVETLRAAAPWQPLRRRSRRSSDATGRIEVRADDFRIKRLKHHTETTTIFIVDASGSTALARLAEAKGAVELLLADCYIRRDQVALIAFSGRGAELLLPPTRALARAKRNLADLPGGGGTPLAAGIEAAGALAETVRRKGHTPGIVMLTDGRANLSRNGRSGRGSAEEDALLAARNIRALGFGALVIDTSTQAQPQAARIADAMGATYIPLPHADAETLSQAVRMQTSGRAR
jgi:magnesium chelatase subunit D